MYITVYKYERNNRASRHIYTRFRIFTLICIEAALTEIITPHICIGNAIAWEAEDHTVI